MECEGKGQPAVAADSDNPQAGTWQVHTTRPHTLSLTKRATTLPPHMYQTQSREWELHLQPPGSNIYISIYEGGKKVEKKTQP